MRENFPLKNPSSLNDDSFSQSLNMPIFKNNKRIFLNQLEKYTSDLLNHLEDLDLNQPKDLSQITDVLSDDLMSERKKNSPMFGKKDYFNKDCQIFPKIFSEKKQFLPSNLNLYYETKGYKNYKYKLFEIDLDEIGKCQKLGRKFDVKKYKEKRSYEKIRSVDSKMNDHKKNKKNNLLILTKKIKKVSENEIQEFLQDLESKESEIDNKNNKSLLPKIQQSKFSIINETIINYKDKIHDKINHLINITNRNGSSLVKLDKNPKEPLIIESFSFNQFKEESNYDNDDKLMKIQMNFLEITKILYKCESMHVSKSKVKLNTDSKKEIKILNEFILLCKDTTNNCYDKKKTGFLKKHA